MNRLELERLAVMAKRERERKGKVDQIKDA